MINSPKPEFGLLSGLRVIMIGLSVAAPFAGELYAEHGADVIWIENPKAVDSARVARKGGSWQQDRRNMRSLTMNYRSEKGKEAFLRLISTTDVLIEASVGGSFDRAGLSDEVLWQANPGLIIAHISGFGQTGSPEYVKRASYDPIAQAFGCAVVAADLPGIREAVRDGESGLIVPSEDAEALGKALMLLAARPEERKRLGGGAFRRIPELLDEEGAEARLKELVLAAVKAARPTRTP